MTFPTPTIRELPATCWTNCGKKNEPRWSAALAANAELRKAVEDTRRVVEQLSRELRSEPLPALSAERRAASAGVVQRPLARANIYRTQVLPPSDTTSGRWWLAAAALGDSCVPVVRLRFGLPIVHVRGSNGKANRQGECWGGWYTSRARRRPERWSGCRLSANSPLLRRPTLPVLTGESGPPSASAMPGTALYDGRGGYAGYGEGLGAAPRPPLLEHVPKQPVSSCRATSAGPLLPARGWWPNRGALGPSGYASPGSSMYGNSHGSESASGTYRGGAVDPRLRGREGIRRRLFRSTRRPANCRNVRRQGPRGTKRPPVPTSAKAPAGPATDTRRSSRTRSWK